jgi:amino acid permease
MQKVFKNRILAIVLYLIPIFVVTILTQSVDIFLLSTGIMSILLSLSMFFIASHIGYKNNKDKYNGILFTGISGILMILIYITRQENVHHFYK